MDTPYIRVECPTKNGKTVSEIIKEFFIQKCSINDAESYYETACTMGEQFGAEAFDKSIELICDELGLSSKELQRIINEALIEMER